MAVMISGFSMPSKCEQCRLENYDPKTTVAICSVTGCGVGWCRKESRPNSCPLAETAFEVTECCPHCGSEVTLMWDVESMGYKTFCPVCGNRLMLCDECQHSAKPRSCDYSSESDTCRHNPRALDIRVDTPLGAILARENSDPAHPGVWLDLRRADVACDMTLALVEFSDDESGFPEGEQHIVTRVWGEASRDDYTTKVIHGGIEDFFRMEECEQLKGEC
ncbi:MAG: hypothetical protein RR365_08845 [Bacteroides sp.]